MSHAYIKLKTRSGIANQCVMFVIKIYIYILFKIKLQKGGRHQLNDEQPSERPP